MSLLLNVLQAFAPKPAQFLPLVVSSGTHRPASTLHGGSLILATYGDLFHRRMAGAPSACGTSFVPSLSEKFESQASSHEGVDPDQQLVLEILADGSPKDKEEELAKRAFFRSEEEERAILVFIRHCFLPRFFTSEVPTSLTSHIIRMLDTLNPETSAIFMAFLFMERLQVKLDDLAVVDCSEEGLLRFRRWFVLSIFFASKMVDDDDHIYLNEWHIMRWMDADLATLRAWERKGYAALGYMLHVTSTEWCAWTNHLFWSAEVLDPEMRAIFNELLADVTLPSPDSPNPKFPSPIFPSPTPSSPTPSLVPTEIDNEGSPQNDSPASPESVRSDLTYDLEDHIKKLRARMNLDSDEFESDDVEDGLPVPAQTRPSSPMEVDHVSSTNSPPLNEALEEGPSNMGINSPTRPPSPRLGPLFSSAFFLSSAVVGSSC